MDECVHIICSNTSFSEYEVLWHDWHWVDRHLENIFRLKGEERRFSMNALLTSCAYAFGGEGNKSGWYDLFESTYTDEELAQLEDQEEAEALAILKIQRAQRTEAFLAAEAAGQQFLITAFDVSQEDMDALAHKQGVG